MRKMCLVCERIPPKEVFRVAHLIFDDVIHKSQIHEIALEACSSINYADNKNRFFFCGRTRYFLLAGLYYLLACRKTIRISMQNIVYSLEYPIGHKRWIRGKATHLTQTSLQISYRRWYQSFPELFTGILFDKGQKPEG